jgi:hypothetical protein
MVQKLMLALVASGLVGTSVLATAVLGALVVTVPPTSQAVSCQNTSNCLVAFAAETLANHLFGVDENEYDLADPLIQPIYQYWKASCGGFVCSDMVSGNVQCVEFVKGVFFMVGEPLTDHPDAHLFWGDYANKPGWTEIPATAFPASQRGLPQPGDLVIWWNLGAGHIAIAIHVVAPQGAKDGSLTVAQGNGPGNTFPPGSSRPGNYYTMPIHPDLSVDTWSGYTVAGYIRQTNPPFTLPSNLPNSPYVQTAVQDAQNVGIPPSYFTEQINQESGYNPKALSPAGAEGIAQFLPATAAGLGINPWDPIQALDAASKLMLSYDQTWGGDYAAALASYNAGSGTVQQCHTLKGVAWLACTPTQTQHYVLAILQLGG